MQSALVKSLIFHAVLVLIIILSSFSFFSRTEVKQEITAITVDLKLAEKTNIPQKPKANFKKIKPAQKPKPKKVEKPKPKEPPKPKPEPKIEVTEKPKEKPKPKEPPKPKLDPKPEPKKEEVIDELSEMLDTLDDIEPEPEISQNNETFNPEAEISVAEKQAMAAMIAEQVRRCWSVPPGARNARNLVVFVDVDVERNGRLKFVGLPEKEKYNSDPLYRITAESARRAILDPRCNPVKEIPPLDKYENWNEIVIDFNPIK